VVFAKRVKSVVATLWKVDDEATSLLIGDFYKNIKTMDAIDALRMAQVNLSANPKFSYHIIGLGLSFWETGVSIRLVALRLRSG